MLFRSCRITQSTFDNIYAEAVIIDTVSLNGTAYNIFYDVGNHFNGNTSPATSCIWIKSANNIHTWYAHDLWDNDVWIDDCIDKLGDVVYVTIDADGFDPSVAPAVGTAEPGGLSWIQGCKLLRRVAERKRVVGFDIVEIAPRENDILTEFTMAKLCYKFLGYLDVNQRI